MTGDIEKGKAGSAFKDFLKEQGTYDETTERAEKRVLSFQLAKEVNPEATHLDHK